MGWQVPTNEAQRLAAVRSTESSSIPLQKSPSTKSANWRPRCTQCPVAYVSLMDDDRLWLKAKYGLPPGFNQCPREIAFCTTTVCGTEMVVAPDLTQDARFTEIPFVTGEPHFKFYCGMPLITAEGYALGTLCVMDFEPRQLTFEQTESVRRLARQVMTQIELRRKLVELDLTVKELNHTKTEMAAEKARTDELLLNILPATIAEELKQNGKVQPKHIPSASILFADFKGFTLLAERTEPVALIGLLDQYFTMFDEIVVRRGLEKVKTIGDAYMAVAGVPLPSRQHSIDACLAALEMLSAVARIRHSGKKCACRLSNCGSAFIMDRSCRASSVGAVHVRYLGRRREYGITDGSEQCARPDQRLTDSGRPCSRGFSNSSREAALRLSTADSSICSSSTD